MIENYSVRIFQNLIINNSKESNIKLIYWLKGTGNMIVNLKSMRCGLVVFYCNDE